MSLKERLMEYIHSDKKRSMPVSFCINGQKYEETIYFTPITLSEMGKIMTLAQGDAMASHVWTLIEKAENEDGTKAFTAEQKPFIEMWDFDTVVKITGNMMKIDSIEEVKKTLNQTPSP